MQTALTFVAILTMAMLLLCGTRPAFILLVVLAVVSVVCYIVVSYILRKRADEKDAKDAVLQKKIANWRKARRRQLRSNADSDDVFDVCGITQDLRLSLEEDEQFCEKKHEIEELETQINLWNRIGDVFKHLLNSCVILVCLLAFSSFIAFAYSYDFALLNDDGSVKELLECQGEQHYSPIDEFGGTTQFSKQIANDNLKRKYAQEHNIPLHEISCKDKQIDKVYEILYRLDWIK